MSSATKLLVADDVEIARRILAHIDAGTTDEGASWREPVENYLSPSRFTAELRMLRAMPSVLVPSVTIPHPGDYVERTVFGVPLFAVRGRDQRARVFRNACRHRGFALVEGAGCTRALVCRYHGWTYRLDGSLSHVPHANAFTDLDMSNRGLVEVASHESDGLIVIGPLDSGDAQRQECADEAMAWLTEGSPWRDKLVPAEQLLLVESTLRAMNWKVLAEQFLEGYHIRSTHKDTFSRCSTTISMWLRSSGRTAESRFHTKTSSGFAAARRAPGRQMPGSPICTSCSPMSCWLPFRT
ncbi:hypothetical protein NJB14197_25750 [Mycobacterium montefiorense]|uniref:Rieske domain-containing protein n=1 Tax=Mycobacterium montefiorense TaxID=154654 RepID=A0AA37PN28_9MYCO|nr:Rieske (2Fe-2S) protein [Mycobacterium montefiorense]GBG37744.1 hypothetical protein MmonteBS_21160 [Mycobacterium montefiorense]GKU34882.1 hypothetical protein NJB14191_22280 [Mycobacterium montefiorense]GKU40895.1 hypothetical protein NJB14192_28810 [Mycobacterium montefiorense]GKU47004.1 hypothetical protein NJB14194_36220 [Mycobacterium montefiorense]GKU49124.1 hypothetical protein NJB14195_03710 [Mycobacterium montefiorense]